MVNFNLRIRRIGLAVLLLFLGGSAWAGDGSGGSGSAWGGSGFAWGRSGFGWGGSGSAWTGAGRIHVIPEPVSVTEKPGSFYLRQGTTLALEGDSTAGLADWMVGQVREQTGILLKYEKGGRGAIVVVVGEKYRGKGK